MKRIGASGTAQFGLIVLLAGIIGFTVVVVPAAAEDGSGETDAQAGGTCGNGICELALGERCDCRDDCGEPGETEINDPLCLFNLNCCSDGVDGDCDGAIDCDDSDCFNDPDCDCGDGKCDADEICNCPDDCGTPPTTEPTCDNGIDDDCDSLTDCDDPDCSQDLACPPICGDALCEPERGETSCECPEDCPEVPIEVVNHSCFNGLDDDCDGSPDCEDPDCVADPQCVSSLVEDAFPHSGFIAINLAPLGCSSITQVIDLTGPGLAVIKRLEEPEGGYQEGGEIPIELVQMDLVGQTEQCGPIVLRNRGSSPGRIYDIHVRQGTGQFLSANAEIDLYFEMELPDPDLGLPDFVAFNVLPVHVQLDGMSALPPIGDEFVSGLLIPNVALVDTSANCSNPSNIQTFDHDGTQPIVDAQACLFHSDCGDPLDGHRCIAGECAMVSKIIVPEDDGTVVANISVGLIVQHARRADLTIDLSNSLSGLDIRLFNPIPQATQANIGNPSTQTFATLDDSGTLFLDNVTVPNPTSTYRATETLSTFNDRSKRGTWDLTLIDHAAGQAGTLVDWKLQFCNGQTTTVAAVDSATIHLDVCDRGCGPDATAEAESPGCFNQDDGTLNGGCDVPGGAFETITCGGKVCGSIARCASDCQPPCATNDDCNDDDVCTFDVCTDTVCSNNQALHGDVAGNGGCGPDGTVNIFDILAILDAFLEAYPEGCSAINFDISSQADPCAPDFNAMGAPVVSLFDILSVLDAFLENSVCGCSGGTSPQGEKVPVIVGDSDWYEIVLNETTRLTWNMSADIDAEYQASIYRAGDGDLCGGRQLVGTATGTVGCDLLTVSACLSPGTYYVVVSQTDAGPNAACGNYTAWLECDECNAPCPGQGDCCNPSQPFTPGCMDPACCSLVCAGDDFCCTTEWDDVCANDAAELCGDLCTP